MRSATMRASLAWTVAVVLLAALAWGLEQVVYAPLETGESYPAFSSLRSDPQGSLALFESLAALPNLHVDRLYKERQKLAPQETMLVLGVQAESWSKLKEPALKQYEGLVADGGRLVIGFLPVRFDLSWNAPAIQARWRIKLASAAGGARTTLAFQPLDGLTNGGWTVFEPRGEPVKTVEKSFGKGTIVLAADTFPLSNQGLRDDRQPKFIARLVGGSSRVTFEENHFGVVESGSVVKLMRRYRLHGAIAILFAVA